MSSPSTNKRSAESASPPAKKPAQDHTACARCARTDADNTCILHSAEWTATCVLCSLCATSFDIVDEAFVLTAIDADDGLPKLGAKAPDQLGRIPSFEGVAACQNCSSRADVKRCYGLRWHYHGHLKRNKHSAMMLCTSCRECNSCRETVAEGEAIDADGDDATGLCANCAQWCHTCDEICDAFHLQDAVDSELNYLCRKVCCSCEGEGAPIEHPCVSRFYCKECVRNDYYYQKGDEDDSDMPLAWEQMKEDCDDPDENGDYD